MECLPFEILNEIFSYLTLKQQVTARCVSKFFKRTIEAIVANDVLQLQINHKSAANVMCRKSLMLFQTDKMKSIHVNECQVESLFKFISKYCPKLEVLDAWTVTTSLESLLSVASGLRYFSLHDLERTDLIADQDEIFSHFPMLEAFDFSWISPHPFCHQQFYNYKKNRNCPVPFTQWIHPCVHSGMCQEELSQIPSNLKSLTWSNLYMRQPLDLSSFDSSLANSLQFLLVTDLEFNGETHLTLPNLRFLRFDIPLELDAIKSILNVLKYSTRLEHILITTELDVESSMKLSRLISSCQQLKYFYLSCPIGRTIDYEGHPLFIPLQPKLIYFCLEFNVPVVLLNTTCLTLQSLTLSVPFSGPINFNLPNLLEFSIILKQRTNNYSSLIDSISRSTNLKYLQIQSHQVLNETLIDHEFITQLFHLLNNLRYLERVHVDIENVTETSQSDFNGDFILNHECLPFLRRLELRICNLTSHLKLCDSFEAIEVSEFSFIGKDKVGSFSDLFNVSTCCRISFYQPMTKLKYLRVTSWNALYRIIDDISVNCLSIEAIELYYFSSDPEQPEDLTPGQVMHCATVISKLPKLTKLDGLFTESFLVHFLTHRSMDFPPFTIEVCASAKSMQVRLFELQEKWIKSGKLLYFNTPWTDPLCKVLN